jgi:H+-translocating NAD(P) transhydrogenase subunit alpha
VDIALLRETGAGERRVALAPSHLKSLARIQISVVVETGAGEGAGFPDAAYEEAGARIAPSAREAAGGAALALRVRPPSLEHPTTGDEVQALPEGGVLVSLLSPGEDAGLTAALEARGITALALERVPRTTRAQRMDVLSSQATVAGYVAVLRAAQTLPRFFPMLTTAAGTIPPARVLVLGAGVAGLQAIATARRLGAAVTGYDVRPAAQEQIGSLGARILKEEGAATAAEGAGGYARSLSTDEATRQLEFLARHVADFDVILTTAQIPGRAAPRLITRAMVESMKPGSVVLDLAGETGGNCELSRPGSVVVHGGVTVDAPLSLPSTLPWHASEMWGRNVIALLEHLVRDGALHLDPSDDIASAMAVTRGPAFPPSASEQEHADHG